MTAFKYYLGLDMGTNSVGWAATDPEYRLLKAKGKDLWGIREFNEASGAVERRTHRISRRRRQREQVRIGILKDYFHDAICEVDPSFFQRLENSKYHEEDKDVEVRYKNNIFNDSNYTDKDYFNEYPTIYHLRNELISSTEKHDVRLVFLALLNMFKHRGHFLNAGLGENNGESNIDNVYFELTELLSELTEYHLSQDIDCKQIEAILSRRDMSRTHKAEELAGVLHVDLKNKPYKELIRGLCGLKFNACVVFPDVQSEEVTKLDICLSESTFDEKSDEIANIIGEDYFEIIMAMKEMFDIGFLASIMKGHNYLSQARVASYTKHKEDLKLLKEVIKKYCGKKEYDKFFNSDADGSYASYVGSYNSKNKERRVGNKRTSEELYKEIKKLLKDAQKEDENVQKILTSIENETFLPKQLTASNGVIPNQVHAREMKKILSNAENYLPFLTEKDETGLSVSERILKLFTFQIPYYVGPTSENSGKNGGNGWVVRREDGQVLPWNIDEKIDMKATSEAFISRMVRRCTYISGEQVLPKASLEYQSYCVLNEINNIKIDGERISVELKQDIYKAVFQKGKKVTKKNKSGKKKNSTVADTTDSNKPPHDGMIYDVNAGTWIDMPEVHSDGFDRSAAEEVWSYVNAERTAVGLNALTWDEDIYNFACQRAQAIVSDFSHNGCGNYGENIALNSAGSAYRIHMQWFYSTGHHNNYMLSSYVKGACAIYVYQGVWYAVENFALEESENSDGTLSCNAYGPEAEAALNEYIDSHDW